MSLEQYDLHTHSRYSDGTTSVSEIARLVKAQGLKGFALTDHDTMRGWEEGRSAASELQLDFVPGVELTTRLGSLGVHLLGYGFDSADPRLTLRLRQIREARSHRAEEMVQRLAQDFPIDWEEIVANSSESIGRPHIADALVRQGIVRDRGAAFATLLSHTSKYYVPNDMFDTVEAVEIVTGAGGVTVVAHPAAIRNDEVLDRREIALLVDAGLRGIELRHPENNPQHIPALGQIAKDMDLLITGSSDFHGAGKANRIGDETTDAATVYKLREAMRFPN
ncbi:PHP domain-containing protein [Canibacter zhoujuaniae]|uniref:PHP domain-containing protein n=1 Tax=Canibacter zhoujuaniae TaxID=2708343 RepID=UPI00141F272B|nr:PHP domain-containing protein [Canibacter zhoujuaniae]